MTRPLDSLRSEARRYAGRAHVPYSEQSVGAILLLSDGTWAPGVRLESAAFSLTIPALLNAYTTAVAAGRSDVVAAVLNRPFRPIEEVFLDDLPGRTFHPMAPDARVLTETEQLPAPTEALPAFLNEPPPARPSDGIALARRAARHAHVPASGFPVGCVLTVGDHLVPGVNVEHRDWTHTLCAERSALGTACTMALLELPSSAAPVPSDAPLKENASAGASLYLSCLEDPKGSLCGACRQLLVELLPKAMIWMDRGSDAPERARSTDLLPGSFRGAAIPRRAAQG